jgi:DNA recombination protein RmuC
MLSELYIYLIAAGAAGLLLGVLISILIYQHKLSLVRNENTHLKTTIELEIKNYNDKIKTLEQSRTQLAETFDALSGQALKQNNEAFLKLATENLKQFQVKAEGELQQREKAIENLVKPIQDALEKTEKQIHYIEKERKESYGALNAQLESMTRTQEALHHQTRSLVSALRRPEVRGQWGELTLKRLAELASGRK